MLQQLHVLLPANVLRRTSNLTKVCPRVSVESPKALNPPP